MCLWNQSVTKNSSILPEEMLSSLLCFLFILCLVPTLEVPTWSHSQWPQALLHFGLLCSWHYVTSAQHRTWAADSHLSPPCAVPTSFADHLPRYFTVFLCPFRIFSFDLWASQHLALDIWVCQSTIDSKRCDHALAAL